MEENKGQIISLMDIYLSAFLTLRGIQPELKDAGGKIIFNFPVSDDLLLAMSEYNSNEPIAVADYVVSIKRLRSQMLAMRGQR